MESESAVIIEKGLFAGRPAEVFDGLLDRISRLIIAETPGQFGLPEDELHREILWPLLPAMLVDDALREYWHERAGAGYLARLTAYLAGGGRPAWEPSDFEIPVAVSYRAGSDARALADTLLSEEALRRITADAMCRLQAAVWAEDECREAAVEETRVLAEAGGSQDLAGRAEIAAVAPAAEVDCALDCARPQSSTRNYRRGWNAGDCHPSWMRREGWGSWNSPSLRQADRWIPPDT